MKLASLFAQYLYTYHRLDLPGIGTFLLDPAVIAILENSKQRSAVAEGISFENNATIKESPDLIAFISLHTGKMKSLAIADLDSYLQSAQQFLNIGKPFVLEGIGTLIKQRPGDYQFIPVTVSAEKIKDYKARDTTQVTVAESSATYESFLDAPPAKGSWKKPVFAVLIIVVVGAAIWGGYTIYKNKPPVTAVENTVVPPAQVVPDTVTVSKEPAPAVSPAATYKYVLEVADSARAFTRYNQLKSYQWKVQLETADSIRYKLFLVLPAGNDTTRTLDSLRVWTGKNVYIEHPAR